MYHIIYPEDDLGKLMVLDLPFSESHCLEDYLLASRREFKDAREARTYAMHLAATHNLEFIPDNEEFQESIYLD